jgi:amidophosphoribosyltransferase
MGVIKARGVDVPITSILRLGERLPEIQDKCGIFGVWENGSKKAAEMAYEASRMQQHRGQAGAGIVTTDLTKLYCKHGLGIVRKVFSDQDIKDLGGSAAIAHVRYRTQGKDSIENIQPFVRDSPYGQVAIAHNGDIVNYQSMKRIMEDNGSVFTTTSDTEVALHLYINSREVSTERRIIETFTKLRPVYSMVILTKDELVGIRDPYGVRPLIVGETANGGFAFASETVAFDAIGAKYVGEVNRGEIIIVNGVGIRRIQVFEPQENLSCIFEHIYFGHPNSIQYGGKFSNAEIRREFGRQLCREHPAEADLIIPVPDSGTDAALGYSEESGIPLWFGLVRDHYFGRSFIESTQSDRIEMVRRKLYPNRAIIKDKSVVLVDDSIVRCNTMPIIVAMMKDCGAKEIHVRISSPPYTYGCYMGIDTAKKEELISYILDSTEKIRDHLQVDSLGYLSQEGMLSNPYLASGGYCTFCFNGIEKIMRAQ